MATDKPRFTITLEEETLNGVLSYKKKNKLATQSKAIQQLIELGLEDLLNGVIEKPSDKSEIERKYNALDAHGKAVVDSVLDLELKRCTGPVKAAGRIIPLFPAAAGPDDLAEGSRALRKRRMGSNPIFCAKYPKITKNVVLGYFFVEKAAPRLIPKFYEKM